MLCWVVAVCCAGLLQCAVLCCGSVLSIMMLCMSYKGTSQHWKLHFADARQLLLQVILQSRTAHNLKGNGYKGSDQDARVPRNPPSGPALKDVIYHLHTLSGFFGWQKCLRKHHANLLCIVPILADVLEGPQGSMTRINRESITFLYGRC